MIARIMIEAGDKSAAQMSPIKNFMCKTYELSWGDQPKIDKVVMHDDEIYSYDVDGKYTTSEPSWEDKPEVEKAMVHEEQQQMQVPTGYE